ncbi:hypothetical protein SAMN05444278_103218 [Psychroflexus salarius]|uniref:DUF6973 domain-containing protein n=1 Tax=Psychroflexus salarius TaxID=1155689 RepID=A0A1M4V2Q4_9FLAO|nr:hypothetical protein [Psychroflexus salarius]SHE63271.1 hypothetical protein SAMN05444278_103218 [Psychroflexus salarius]
MYVVHANTHTITLKISRPQADYPLENLVLHYNVDTQTYDEYLIQYDISLEELEQIENGIDFELQDKNQMIVRQLENGTLNDMMAKLCQNNCTTIDVMCESGAHAPGQSCNLDDGDQPYTYQSCSLICTSPNINTIDAGDSSSAGGRTMVTNPNVLTPSTPQISTIFQLTTQYLSAVHSWWWASQATPSQKSAIETFLDNSQDSQGYYSQEALAFVKEAIQVLLNNPDAEVDWDLTNYPGIDEGLPFGWWNNESFIENNFTFNLDDEGFGDLTEQEELLIKLFPLHALIIKANVDEAHTETENRYGNSARNDKSDAFRHAFFNAMNSNDAGDTIARLFSTAHESEVPAHLILEVQMDLHNNDIGHLIGDNASFFVSDQDLSDSVYTELLNGNLRYLSPLGPVIPPNFGINPSTQLTPTNQ